MNFKTDSDREEFIEIDAPVDGTLSADLSGLTQEFIFMAHDVANGTLICSNVRGLLPENLDLQVRAGEQYILRVQPISGRSKFQLDVNVPGDQ